MTVEYYEKYERCVLCNKKTDVLKSMPIELRKHYIIGCGQLCDTCFAELENEKKTEVQ